MRHPPVLSPPSPAKSMVETPHCTASFLLLNQVFSTPNGIYLQTFALSLRRCCEHQYVKTYHRDWHVTWKQPQEGQVRAKLEQDDGYVRNWRPRGRGEGGGGLTGIHSSSAIVRLNCGHTTAKADAQRMTNTWRRMGSYGGAYPPRSETST